MNENTKSALLNRIRKRLHKLPLVMLALTSRCNNRCNMCSYWKSSPVDFPLDLVRPLVDDLTDYSCRALGLTGGEPLLHPHFSQIFKEFTRIPQCRLFIMSNGTTLERLQEDQLQHISEIFVSLDGHSEILHNDIRGVQCFRKLLSGIDYVLELKPELKITARCTVQRKNWQHLLAITKRAREMRLSAISFVAVDSSSQAYGRENVQDNGLQNIYFPHHERLELRQAIPKIVSALAPFIGDGFILESQNKVNHLLHSLCFGDMPDKANAPLCNSPYFSLYISEKADLSPCFFRPPAASLYTKSFAEILSSESYFEHAKINGRIYSEYCRKCTCSLYSGPHFLRSLFMAE